MRSAINYNLGWQGISCPPNLPVQAVTATLPTRGGRKTGRWEEEPSSLKVWWANTQKGTLSCYGEYPQRRLSAELLSFKHLRVYKILHFHIQTLIHQIMSSPAKNNAGIPSAEFISTQPDSLPEQVYPVYAMSQGSWKRWLMGHVISEDRGSQAGWLKTLHMTLNLSIS